MPMAGFIVAFVARMARAFVSMPVLVWVFISGSVVAAPLLISVAAAVVVAVSVSIPVPVPVPVAGSVALRRPVATMVVVLVLPRPPFLFLLRGAVSLGLLRR
jgi:hypothetical protein